MSEIIAIGEKDQIIGFQGLGVRIVPARNTEEFAAGLHDATRNPEVEIILIPETFAEEEGAEHIRSAREKSDKVIILIPDHHGSKGLSYEQMRSDVELALGIDLISKQ